MAKVYTLVAVIICRIVVLKADACSVGCLACKGNTCSNCTEGYFLGSNDCVKCQYPNCLTCYSQYDRCLSCKQGFWSLSCNNPCAPGCLNGTCNFNDGDCQCKGGFHSLYCYQKCSPNCQDVCDTITGACKCKPGYYGDYCTKTCLAYCAKCTNGTLCSVCPVGQYTSTCRTPCKTKCIDGSCDIYTGECVNNLNCTANCSICTGGYNCTSCVDGYYGSSCELSCPYNCVNSCYKLTGHCFNCTIGWFGNQCDNNCTSQCKIGCNRYTGKCNECKTGYYGDQCQYSCSQHCLNNAGGADGRLCSSDGTCINGCRLGFGGSQCNVSCPVTCAEVASGSRCSDNGSCAAGCIDRYSGEKCELLTSTESSAVYTSGNAAVIAGPVVGGVCFIAGCVIITLLVMKKRQKQKDTNEYYNVRTFAAGSQATPANTQKDTESDYTDLGVSREQMNTYSSLREGSHILNSQQTHSDAETNYTTLGDKREEEHTYSSLREGNS